MAVVIATPAAIDRIANAVNSGVAASRLSASRVSVPIDAERSTAVAGLKGRSSFPVWACRAPEWHSGGHRFDPGQVQSLRMNPLSGGSQNAIFKNLTLGMATRVYAATR